MTVPLPGGYADELMWHLTNCQACIASKIFMTSKCSRGQQLVKLTLIERHGPGAAHDERRAQGRTEQGPPDGSGVR